LSRSTGARPERGGLASRYVGVLTHEPEHYLRGIMLYFFYIIGSTLEREWGTPNNHLLPESAS
jgi:hypothetical protein